MRICGKSVTWVRQHLSLLRLCPEVQEMMRHNDLPHQVCLALMNVTHESQREISTYIIDNKLTLNRALDYIRSKRDRTNLAPEGRLRTPVDDYRRLNRFLNRANADLGLFLDMPLEKFKAMFRNRPPEDLSATIKSVSRQLEELKELKETLGEIKMAAAK